ncbi:MAG: hypothetical protein ABSB53_07520 [Nitrososphaerales archaeon]|jgi:hypothetical protein
MGSHSGDFELAFPVDEVFSATKDAIQSLQWELIEADEVKREIVAKTPGQIRHAYWTKASYGTTVTARLSAAGGVGRASSLHIESKTRFRLTVLEGRTKCDVKVLHEKVAEILSGQSSA